jgi:hypothetical protein
MAAPPLMVKQPVFIAKVARKMSVGRRSGWGRSRHGGYREGRRPRYRGRLCQNAGAQARGRPRGRETSWLPRRHGSQRRHRHSLGHNRYGVHRLAPAAGGEPGRCVPLGEACRAGHAARGRRLHCHHVVAGRLARGGGACRPQRHQGRCAPVREGHAIKHAEDNIRVNSVHPGIIDTDIWRKMVPAADVGPSEPTDIHVLPRTFVPLARAGGRSAERRRRRAVPRVGDLGLHEGRRAGHRRGHVQRRDAAAGTGSYPEDESA